MSVSIRGKSTLDLRLWISGCTASSAFRSSGTLVLAEYSVRGVETGLSSIGVSERQASSVSDGVTSTYRRSGLNSGTGRMMGFCSTSPLHLGSSSTMPTTELPCSLAMDAASSSTLGGGGKGPRRTKKVEDLYDFGPFGLRGSSLDDWFARTGLDNPGFLALWVVQVPVDSNVSTSVLPTMLNDGGRWVLKGATISTQENIVEEEG